MEISAMDSVESWLNSPDKLERNDQYIASLIGIRDRITLSRENDLTQEKTSSRGDYPQVLEDLDVYIRFFQSDSSVSWDAFWEAEQKLVNNRVLPNGWEKVERTRLTALWVPEVEQTRIIVGEKVVHIHPKT